MTTFEKWKQELTLEVFQSLVLEECPGKRCPAYDICKEAKGCKAAVKKWANQKDEYTNGVIIFSQNVKKYRTRRGWSQKYLSKKIGISHLSLWEIENGKSFVRAETLLNIAGVFNIDVYQLFMSNDE